MMDDIDRDCCYTVAQAVKNGLADYAGASDLKITQVAFHDPGIDLKVEWENTGMVGNPTVMVEIRYGDKKVTPDPIQKAYDAMKEAQSEDELMPLREEEITIITLRGLLEKRRRSLNIFLKKGGEEE